METTLGMVQPWSTATFGGSVGTSPHELLALGEHLRVCRNSHGRLLALRCAADAMRGFIVSRMVTSLVTVGLLVVLVRLAL
jgi:hypothetical protein